MRDWQKRALVTLGALAVLEFGSRIPLPGIAVDLPDFMATGRGFARRGSLFSLGIMPYLSAALFMMLLSGVVPVLRRLREGDPGQRLRFDRLILIFTLLLALVQGWSVGVFHRNFALELHGQGQVIDTFWPPLTAIALAAGTLITVLLAHLVTARGLGNGVALIFIVGGAERIWRALHIELTTPLLPAPAREHWLGVGLLSLVFVLALLAWQRAGRPLRLLDEQGEPVFIAPLRLNHTGVLPLMGSAGVLGVLGMLPGVSALVLRPDPIWWYYLVQLVLAALLNLMFTAWILDPADLRRRAARWGLRVEGGGDEKMFDLILMRLFWPQTMVLWLMILVRPLVPAIANLRGETATLLGGGTLVGIALIFEFRRRIVDREAAARIGADRCVLASRVALEAELARLRLTEAGIPARVVDDRVIGVTGSRAPWELCRPRFPAFFNYPYLGGGRLRLLVTPEREAAARAEIDRWVPEN